MLPPGKPAPILRVAIVRTSSLGDVVLATSCLSLLAALPYTVDITWIGRTDSLDMIKRSWPQVTTIELPKRSSIKGLQEIIGKLKNLHLIIDLQCNLRSRWLCRKLKMLRGVPYFEAEKAQILRSKLIFKARIRGRRRPLQSLATKPSFYQYKLMYETLLRGLKEHIPLETFNSVRNRLFYPHLPIPNNFDPPWRKELRFGLWLAIAPGAAYATKQSPLSLIQKILKNIQFLIENTLESANSSPITKANGPLALRSLGLVIVGDSKDRDQARILLDRLHWTGPLLNLAGKLSLWESAVALHEACVLMANDSSLAHIAEAVDTPVAMLFGPTIETFGFAPHRSDSRAFSSMTGCRPCSKHGIISCRYQDQLCFHSIEPNRVSEFIVQHLNSNYESKHSDPKREPEKNRGENFHDYSGANMFPIN